jgi:hypothetical protein
VIDAVENVSRVLEAEQKRADTSLLLRGEQMMPPGNRTCAFTESLQTEHLAPNRADEFFASSVSRTTE